MAADDETVVIGFDEDEIETSETLKSDSMTELEKAYYELGKALEDGRFEKETEQFKYYFDEIKKIKDSKSYIEISEDNTARVETLDDLPVLPNNEDEVKSEPVRKFCPQCGTRYEPGDIFCGECGKRLN